MSSITERFIICDGCPGHSREKSRGVTYPETIPELRKELIKDKGWISKKGYDYCPDCVKRLEI